MPWARLPPNLPVIMPERFGTITPAQGVSEMVGSDSYRFVAEARVPGAHAVYTRFGGYVPRPNGTASFMAGLRIGHFKRVEWLPIPRWSEEGP
jgi:peptide/nickel transport system substrate-binding protein